MTTTRKQWPAPAKLTPRQDKKYWREWAAYRRAMIALGHVNPDRQATHAAAGVPASHKVWSNDDFTKWLQVVWRTTQPDSLPRQMKLRSERAYRLDEIRRCLALYLVPMGSLTIDQAVDRWIDAICRRLYAGRMVESLDEAEAFKLNMTLWSRLQPRRRAAGHTVAEMLEKAGCIAPAPAAPDDCTASAPASEPAHEPSPATADCPF